VSAGKGQVITLPVISTTLTGTATGNGGATIAVVTWKQSSGPATATITSASSLSTAVSGMTVAGSYVYTMYATDNNGKSANGSITVMVNAAPATKPAPPTVTVGANQTITLPTSAATLTATATANGGDAITSTYWEMMSGPSWVKFSNMWALSTAVTGMSAGTYVFEVQVTDNQGLVTMSAPVTITIKAAGTTATTSTAVSGQATAFGDSTGTVDSAIVGQAGNVQLYPNPVHDLLNVYLNNRTTGKVVIAIYNGAGNRVLLSEAAKDGVVFLRSIDVSGLPKGLYVVQVVAGASARSVGKFIKL
jgi:hypothetical protein